MIGKANEVKVKQVFTEYRDREVINLDVVLNRTLGELGNATIIQIQYQMGQNDGADSALITYKEGESNV